MAATQLTTSGHQVSKTLKRISWSFKAPDSEEDQENINLEDDEDDILCVSGSRLIRTGLRNTDCEDNVVMFVNAGGGALNEVMFFQGGDVLRTDETIIGDGDYPSIYQSAQFGSFWYQFDHLRPGDYFVDLHFVEIINTNGPKGMRVFDVFIQEEKVLSRLDIYSIVRANRPLELIDVRVHVGADGEILIRFKGIHGSPIISGICIKEAPKSLASQVENGHLICNNCAAEIELSSAEDKLMRMKSTAKYEKKIEDLSTLCQLKSDECYEAWMSLATSNEQLEKLRMELDKTTSKIVV